MDGMILIMLIFRKQQLMEIYFKSQRLMMKVLSRYCSVTIKTPGS